MRRTRQTCLALSAACLTFAAVPFANADNHAAPTVEITNFIGTINWDNGGDTPTIDITDNDGAARVSDGDHVVTLDGGIDEIKNTNCQSSYGKWSIGWGGRDAKSGSFGGYKDLKDYPIVSIDLPRDAHLVIRNSVIFTDGAPDIGSADIELNHCGEVRLGDVASELDFLGRGSSDLNVGDVGSLAADMRGSGDLSGEDIGDILLNMHGSGDVEFGNTGNVAASIKGSGDFDVADIRGGLDLTVSGSGDVSVEDLQGDLTYDANGSGDLAIDEISAKTAVISVSGSGDVSVDDGTIEDLTIRASGASEVEFDGTAGRANLTARGASEIYVARVTGEVEMDASGAADIHIDTRD